MTKGGVESPTRCELEQTPLHTTQRHPNLGLQGFSFRQTPPFQGQGPQPGPLLSHCGPSPCSTFALKRPGAVGGPCLVSSFQCPCSHFFFFFFWSLAPCREFSFQEFPTQSVPRKSACSQSPDGKRVPGTMGICFHWRLLCTDPVPQGPPRCPCCRFSSVTQRKPSLMLHGASESQAPTWQSPPRAICIRPLAGCVTVTKSRFLRLGFHLCEVGRMAVPTYHCRGSELTHRRGLHTVEICPGGGPYSWHRCGQDLRMAMSVGHPARRDRAQGTRDLRGLFRQKDMIAQLSF